MALTPKFLSQITPSGAAPVLNDRLVGVSAGNSDLLYTVAEVFKAFSARTINLQATSSYTLGPSDAGAVVLMNSGVANTLTIPANIFVTGTEIDVMQIGMGTTAFVPALGVNLISASASFQMAGQYFAATLLQIQPNVWTLAGGLNP